jgi:predicted DNA-binding transcriptional regulator AlpA
MRGLTYRAQPTPERTRTLDTLTRAGVTDAPRMKGEWRYGRQLAAIDGSVESTLTRRQMLEGLPPLRRERKLEEAAAFGISLDERDRQFVRLPYLLPDAAEETLGQWVDRQYALGRIAEGYSLIKVEPDLNIDAFLDTKAAADRLGMSVPVMRNYRRHQYTTTAQFPEPDEVFSGAPVWRTSTIDAWQAGRRGHGGPAPRKGSPRTKGTVDPGPEAAKR